MVKLQAELAATVAAEADARTALKAANDLLHQRDAAIEVLSRDLVHTHAELEKVLAAAASAKVRAAAQDAERARAAERAIEAAWNYELPLDGQEVMETWPQEQEHKRKRGCRGGGYKRQKEDYEAWLLQNPWWNYGWKEWSKWEPKYKDVE